MPVGTDFGTAMPELLAPAAVPVPVAVGANTPVVAAIGNQLAPFTTPYLKKNTYQNPRPSQ